MKRLARLLIALSAGMLLAGCLEVEQFPPWRQGEYNGKPDDLRYARNFHGDRLAWSAQIINRNLRQDEYHRTWHRGGPP